MDYNNVINSAKTVLVEFFASWCPHCQRMMPIVEQVKSALGDKADVYQFDIDKYKELSEQQKVEYLPTFIIYNDGKEAWRQSGELAYDALLGKVQSFL